MRSIFLALMLMSFAFESTPLIVHPFRPEDLARYTELISDIYSILSDEKTVRFLPTKRLCNKIEAEALLQARILGHHSNRSYLHFITDRTRNEVVGMIDLITPEMAKTFYALNNYPYFVEFYLKRQVSRRKRFQLVLECGIRSLKRQKGKLAAVLGLSSFI